jgi:hypothetical protein
MHLHGIVLAVKREIQREVHTFLWHGDDVVAPGFVPLRYSFATLGLFFCFPQRCYFYFLRQITSPTLSAPLPLTCCALFPFIPVWYLDDISLHLDTSTAPCPRLFSPLVLRTRLLPCTVWIGHMPLPPLSPRKVPAAVSPPFLL